MNLHLNSDAFSSGQMASKLWLCRELEKLFSQMTLNIWILGGWYGLLSQIILLRERLDIASIRSFDIDSKANEIADQLNEFWLWKEWQFKAFSVDANQINFSSSEYESTPDLIINTSTEHFDCQQWFDNIPYGSLVALQSNNLKIKEHCNNCENLEMLEAKYPLKRVLYKGQLQMDYSDQPYLRFMLIGKK